MRVVKKPKVSDNDLIVERDEDIPQIVQLKSGDLGADEYLKLKSKQDIESAHSTQLYSFHAILAS